MTDGRIRLENLYSFPVFIYHVPYEKWNSIEKVKSWLDNSNSTVYENGINVPIKKEAKLSHKQWREIRYSWNEEILYDSYLVILAHFRKVEDYLTDLKFIWEKKIIIEDRTWEIEGNLY